MRIDGTVSTTAEFLQLMKMTSRHRQRMSCSTEESGLNRRPNWERHHKFKLVLKMLCGHSGVWIIMFHTTLASFMGHNSAKQSCKLPLEEALLMDCLQGKEFAKRSRQLVYHIFLILGERFWLSIRQLIDHHPLINISRSQPFFLAFFALHPDFP